MDIIVDIKTKLIIARNNLLLMRSVPQNPVVAECAITHQREVASTPIRCQYFKQRMGEAKINPMIPCK